jgi:hypothetical protein
MNPFTYYKQKREEKRRRQTAILMLHKSSVLRSGQESIRYAMSPRELKQMLEKEEK